MSLDPAGKSAQCRVVLGNQPVGRTPWSARDALVPPVHEESVGCDHRGADQGAAADEGVHATVCAIARKRENYVA